MASRKSVKRAPKRERPGGRPSSYKPEFVEQARKLCELGATDVELADFFGVAINTISNWKTRYPEFLGALKVGKGEVDDRVERTLLQRAFGYTFDSVKIFPPRVVVRKAKGKKTTVTTAPVMVPYREHVPPDVTALIFWLKNRRKDAWRDVQRVEHDVKVGLSERLEAALKRANAPPAPAAKAKKK